MQSGTELTSWIAGTRSERNSAFLQAVPGSAESGRCLGRGSPRRGRIVSGRDAGSLQVSLAECGTSPSIRIINKIADDVQFLCLHDST